MTNVPIEDDQTFEFETKILEGGKSFSIGIGFTTSTDVFGEDETPEEFDQNTIGLVLNDKVVCHGQNYIQAFYDNNANGDVIKCRLEQHHAEKDDYLLFEVLRNGCFLQRKLVREQKIYPCIWVTSGDVVLQTRFRGMYLYLRRLSKYNKDTIK